MPGTYDEARRGRGAALCVADNATLAQTPLPRGRFQTQTSSPLAAVQVIVLIGNLAKCRLQSWKQRSIIQHNVEYKLRLAGQPQLQTHQEHATYIQAQQGGRDRKILHTKTT